MLREISSEGIVRVIAIGVVTSVAAFVMRDECNPAFIFVSYERVGLFFAR